MSTFDAIADLPVQIEECELEGREITLGSFERLTTLVKVRGGGHEGIGEDVTYDAVDHIALRDAGPPEELRGSDSFSGFSDLIGGLDLFPSPPERDVSRPYRRWAFESAVLDLALRQAGTNLAAALGREARPVNFVSSMRLASSADEASSIEPLLARLAVYPTLRFKLDPVNDWTDELIAALVETGAVDSLDLKGFYKGTVVDVETDPELYRKLIEAFPDAWLEDPDVNEETKPLLDPVAERITWDAPIHSVSDIEAMPWEPKMVNIKPSRFGAIEELFGAYDYCEERGLGAYGGGQTELGEGRGHIQYLASIFHPHTPNDVAPRGYNDPEQATKPGLPASPLEPAIDEIGFRWLS
jgi:L-alanine-DL-glutamate epimerase-like enolase superfamily enzyme